MNYFHIATISLCMANLMPSSVLAGNIVTDFMAGDASGSFRLRYESADADDGTKDSAAALTVRTRLAYQTKGMNGLSAHIEFEDVQALLGINDYFDNGTISNGKTTYDTIGDPAMTEVNESYLKYMKDALEIKVGKQRIVFDSMRFVGHVGWRQDDQTFDALKATFKIAGGQISAAYIDQVNGIFGDVHKIDKSDVLLNASYKVGAMGTATGYAYILDNKDADTQSDTFGARFNGKAGMFKYTAEFATQSSEATTDNDATYMLLEGGAAMAGVNAALGMEILGSDGAAYGFSTDLATKHAFNGWADVFINTPGSGLQDIYVKVGTKMAGIKLLGVYHTYTADDDGGTGLDDFGSELNLLAVKKLENNVSVGFKYAAYSAGDAGVDVTKMWLWSQVSF